MSGPLPRYVYVRRRLVLLAVVIALVWVGFHVAGLMRGGSSSGKKSAVTPATSSASPSDASSGNHSAGSTTTSGSSGTSQVSLTVAAKACDPENVNMLAWVPTGQTAGKPVTINLVFSTSTEGGCTLTPAAAQLVVVISAGGTPVYDSDVCKASLLTSPVALAQGWATQAAVTWTGRGSGRSCSASESYASAGQYVLQIGTLGGIPAKVSFDLARGVTPTPTPTPTASGSASPSPSTKTSAAPRRGVETPSADRTSAAKTG